jgi:hypothetical protein
MSIAKEIQNEDKLGKIQKELNAWKRYTLCLLILVTLIIGALIWGCIRGKEKIVAQRFTLVDELGHPRAALGMLPGKHPALIMFDAQGKSCAAFGVDPDG